MFTRGTECIEFWPIPVGSQGHRRDRSPCSARQGAELSAEDLAKIQSQLLQASTGRSPKGIERWDDTGKNESGFQFPYGSIWLVSICYMLVFSCVYSWGFSHGWDDPGGRPWLYFDPLFVSQTWKGQSAEGLCAFFRKKKGFLVICPLTHWFFFFLSWWSGIVYWA